MTIPTGTESWDDYQAANASEAAGRVDEERRYRFEERLERLEERDQAMSIKQESVTQYFTDRVVMEFRGKVWDGQPIQSVEVLVDEDGTVRAWDGVAGHWTTCHSITDRNQSAIRKAAGIK